MYIQVARSSWQLVETSSASQVATYTYEVHSTYIVPCSSIAALLYDACVHRLQVCTHGTMYYLCVCAYATP